MLCQLQQETGRREGFGFSFEEFVVGSVVDYGGLSVLPDAYLFQRQRRGYGHPAGDVLRQGFLCLGGSGGDVHRSVDTESRVPQLIKLVAILALISSFFKSHSRGVFADATAALLPKKSSRTSYICIAAIQISFCQSYGNNLKTR
jgi:hypothetical protein